MKALIVKLTSMGDLVQALPALTDASRANPDLSFDWVVDEAFAEVPLWHPSVSTVIKTAHRRWRRSPGAFARESLGFWKELRQVRYDLVIDAQTNLKSALVTALARGPKHGPDRDSVREKPAHWAYGHHYALAHDSLAVDRWRDLFAQVLGYQKPGTAPDFGLTGRHWPRPEQVPGSPYVVFVPNASWDNKYWVVKHWQTLADRARSQGLRVLIPWGSEKERQWVLPLAHDRAHVTILPRMTLSEIAGIMIASCGTVAMDTGLAHVSAALDVPTVTLYGPTDPRLIGATGRRSRHLVATGYDCIPCYRRECHVEGYRGPVAQCLKRIEPDDVWTAFQALMD